MADLRGKEVFLAIRDLVGEECDRDEFFRGVPCVASKDFESLASHLLAELARSFGEAL